MPQRARTGLRRNVTKKSIVNQAYPSFPDLVRGELKFRCSQKPVHFNRFIQGVLLNWPANEEHQFETDGRFGRPAKEQAGLIDRLSTIQSDGLSENLASARELARNRY